SNSSHTVSWAVQAPLGFMPVHFLKHIALAGPLAAISTGAATATVIKASRNDRILPPPCLPCSLQRCQYVSATFKRQDGVALVPVASAFRRRAVLRLWLPRVKK